MPFADGLLRFGLVTAAVFKRFRVHVTVSQDRSARATASCHRRSVHPRSASLAGARAETSGAAVDLVMLLHLAHGILLQAGTVSENIFFRVIAHLHHRHVNAIVKTIERVLQRPVVVPGVVDDAHPMVLVLTLGHALLVHGVVRGSRSGRLRFTTRVGPGPLAATEISRLANVGALVVTSARRQPGVLAPLDVIESLPPSSCRVPPACPGCAPPPARRPRTASETKHDGHALSICHRDGVPTVSGLLCNAIRASCSAGAASAARLVHRPNRAHQAPGAPPGPFAMLPIVLEDIAPRPAPLPPSRTRGRHLLGERRPLPHRLCRVLNDCFGVL